MKKNTINLSTIATADSFGIINTLVDHYGIIARFESIDDIIAKRKTALDKAKLTMKELDRKYEKAFANASLSSFASVTWTAEDTEKQQKTYERVQALKRQLETLENEKAELIDTISAWTDKDGNSFADCDKAVEYYTALIMSLHTVDRRTIEILSSLMYDVSLAMPNKVRASLDRYYNFKVAHAFSGNGNKDSKDLKDLEKEVRNAVQEFVNAYSIIYNEERTSEGLFVPQHFNVNATEVSLFIDTYFKGTKIDKVGMTTANYGTEKSVVSELNKLMLCKFQGLKYGQQYKIEEVSDGMEMHIVRIEK